MSKPFFVTLPGRALITVQGPDRHDFLQGLITNDMGKLKNSPSLYACLLTPQGKFLFDFFVFEKDKNIFLDCEGGTRAEELLKNLQMHKLRSNIELSLKNDIGVYAVFGSEEGIPDPRHLEMGTRTHDKPELEEKGFNVWDLKRLELGVPDGSRDMEPSRSTLLECNIDKFNGIDWDKGCYMGQELTARMHHRGLAKRHLYRVQIAGQAPEPFSDIELNRSKVGNMRSSCGDVGLALLKDDTMETMTDGAIIPLPVTPAARR